MPVGGIFPDLKDVTVLMILRGEQSFVPPYEELPLAAGDLVIVAATRQALAELVKGMPGLLHPEPMAAASPRSEEHTSELQSLMRISYAVFCLKKKKYNTRNNNNKHQQHT